MKYTILLVKYDYRNQHMKKKTTCRSKDTNNFVDKKYAQT